MNDVNSTYGKSKATGNRILLIHVKHSQNKDVFQRLVQMSQVWPEIAECIQNMPNLTANDLQVQHRQNLFSFIIVRCPLQAIDLTVCRQTARLLLNRPLKQPQQQKTWNSIAKRVIPVALDILQYYGVHPSFAEQCKQTK